MPPKQKVKSAKSGDDDSKKSKGKKTASTAVEELEQSTDAKDEQSNTGLSTETVVNSFVEVKEPTVIPDEIVEVKYEEPVLTYIIVESYDGEKEKGLFQGLGKAIFKGGNVYEGEFNLGMMTGKGKYTWSNDIVYEGDFLNNEISGTGVYRWPNPYNDPCATYEGEVYKGKRHGSGIFKSGTVSVTYFGEWNTGKRYGKGKIIYNAEGTSFYEGDWINNRKFGWGIRHYITGNVYEGMWVNDIRHGEGTMKWFDKNQIYTGQWENGVQNGLGEHNWYLARVEMTQYALRNTYYGTFKEGKRQGQGTFLYANGAKYEGNWENNLKHGWGKYTFKDGTAYEGYFEDDKMTDSPTYRRSSILAQEISKIKTRIPSAGTTLNIHMLKSNVNKEFKKIEFDLKLELDSILRDFLDDEKNKIESAQALKTIIRYLDLFKQIYRFYSQLGFDSSPDNTYVLNRMQFWRFLKDCKLHVNDIHLTLMDFDRLLNPNMKANDLHCPYDKILIRQFFNYIVLAGYHLYKNKFDGIGCKISWCIEKIITENLLPYACNVQGYFYVDARKTLTVLAHMVKSYEIYRFMCTKRKKSPNDWSITLRKLLNVFNDYKLLDNKLLSPKILIEIMANDNPLVFDLDDSYNLELEITFLEFFEILIGCSIRLNEPQDAKKNNLNQKNSRSSLVNASGETNLNAPQTVNEAAIADNSTNNQPAAFALQAITSVLNSNRPVSATEVNMNASSNEQDTKRAELELNEWVEKNNFFFEKKFFPSAENFETLTRIVNASLDF